MHSVLICFPIVSINRRFFLQRIRYSEHWRATDRTAWANCLFHVFFVGKIESNIGLRFRQRKDKRIMPETRFTEFPALSVDPRVGISRSVSETDE